ncbi:MAG: hypothetical protein Q9P01_21020 [Anaerolineae bacterium]|nr:hypothetical protein [Anaerolineae bacterium]MDQ7037230.1 hypothetical protein [Anaerolineae bacterium]
MNDELAGQLTQDWEIPAYARTRLWLDSETGSSQCEGNHGLFELDAPTTELTLRWGSADGAPLKRLKWQADNLQWDGSVALGGMVEMLHLTELPTLDDLPVSVVHFSAQPLLADARPYPDASQRHLSEFPIPYYVDSVDDTMRPMMVTLLTLSDSPLTSHAQEAMLQKIPMHIYGRLADEAQGWHRFFALPILWESVSLFAP